MEFIPLYFKDKIRTINKYGYVGVVTLWSSPDYVLEKRFKRANIDISANTSPIAAISTFYGGGIREFLRNILYNPQIRYIVAYGRDRSNSF